MLNVTKIQNTKNKYQNISENIILVTADCFIIASIQLSSFHFPTVYLIFCLNHFSDSIVIMQNSYLSTQHSSVQLHNYHPFLNSQYYTHVDTKLQLQKDKVKKLISKFKTQAFMDYQHRINRIQKSQRKMITKITRVQNKLLAKHSNLIDQPKQKNRNFVSHNSRKLYSVQSETIRLFRTNSPNQFERKQSKQVNPKKVKTMSQRTLKLYDKAIQKVNSGNKENKIQLNQALNKNRGKTQQSGQFNYDFKYQRNNVNTKNQGRIRNKKHKNKGPISQRLLRNQQVKINKKFMTQYY